MKIRVLSSNEPGTDRLLTWLIANRLNPDVIPSGSDIIVSRRRITVRVWLHTPDGGFYLDPSRNEIATGTLQVPLLVPLDDVGVH